MASPSCPLQASIWKAFACYIEIRKTKKEGWEVATIDVLATAKRPVFFTIFVPCYTCADVSINKWTPTLFLDSLSWFCIHFWVSSSCAHCTESFAWKRCLQDHVSTCRTGPHHWAPPCHSQWSHCRLPGSSHMVRNK
jgi:hypothetical protein